jgi:hypothetical protein
MTTVVPGAGIPPPGISTTSAPGAEPSRAVPEQLSYTGGDKPNHPSGIFAITAASSYDDEHGADGGRTGTSEVIADLGKTT